MGYDHIRDAYHDVQEFVFGLLLAIPVSPDTFNPNRYLQLHGNANPLGHGDFIHLLNTISTQLVVTNGTAQFGMLNGQQVDLAPLNGALAERITRASLLTAVFRWFLLRK